MPSCLHCTADFTVSDDERALLQKMSVTIGPQTFALPEPTLCPDCRLRRRTVHRNERFLYRVKSDLSNQDMVSIYARTEGSRPYRLYQQDEWRSDQFNPLAYGRDFDFQRPFFEQFDDLLHDVPRLALITMSNENSDFSTGTGFCKNCYLINSSEYCEDCYYGKLFQSSKDSVDCAYLYDSELCYECFSVYNSHQCSFLLFSKNCSDCHFSSNLTNCSNCFLCTNLNRKEYHFQNQPLDPEEYKRRLREVQGSFAHTEQARELLRTMRASAIQRATNIVNSMDCTGDYIENSKNCRDCYDMTDSEDCRYVTVGVAAKDCYECSNMYVKPELCYDTLGTIEAYGTAYSLYIFHSQRMFYCDTCYHSSDCFGCSGLTRHQYCILNKQYTKEEYEQLVPQIIEYMQKTSEWGSFFPSSLSPFAYNETLANEYFPLTKEKAVERGYRWRDHDPREYKPQTITLPDRIDETADSITQDVLACADCRKNYRIIPQELRFYRKQLLPIPRRCPDCRYDLRMRQRNPRLLWPRTCAHCHADIQTTYAPDRPETVYCEKCYLETVY